MLQRMGLSEEEQLRLAMELSIQGMFTCAQCPSPFTCDLAHVSTCIHYSHHVVPSLQKQVDCFVLTTEWLLWFCTSWRDSSYYFGVED